MATMAIVRSQGRTNNVRKIVFVARETDSEFRSMAKPRPMIMCATTLAPTNQNVFDSAVRNFAPVRIST